MRHHLKIHLNFGRHFPSPIRFVSSQLGVCTVVQWVPWLLCSQNSWSSCIFIYMVYDGHSIRGPAAHSESDNFNEKSFPFFFQSVLIEILSSIFGRRYLRLRIERKSWPDTHHCYHIFFFYLNAEHAVCCIFPLFVCALALVRHLLLSSLVALFLFAGITLSFCGNEKKLAFSFVYGLRTRGQFFRAHCLHGSNQQTIKNLMNNASEHNLFKIWLTAVGTLFCHETTAM